jgi:hypothetical protein
MSRGYLVMAQGSYIAQAEDLAASILATQSEVKAISVITDCKTSSSLFDHVISLPYRDLTQDSDWKIHNRAYFYDLSPYDETVILDADMLFLTDVSWWWDYMARHKFLTTTRVKTFRNTWVDSDAYRAAFRSNGLINAYSAFTYFAKNSLSEQIFRLIKMFITDWETWSRYLCPTNRQTWPSIDLALAMSINLLGCQQEVTSLQAYPTFTHMKASCQGWTKRRPQWEDILGVYTNGPELRIGPYYQTGILHYVNKDFVTDQIRKIFV